MSAEPAEGKRDTREGVPAYRRIGHKGADAMVTGNTPESFDVAVDHGVDMIELDVLRAKEGKLVVAHDYHDALVRRPMDLTEALDLFLEPPLDQVEIDCDLKLAGREAELAGALAGRGLVGRAMVSTMEVESLLKLRQLDPDLRLGWTYPKPRRD
jgi:glycerophosphoryl diester phosphodiesterase